MAPSDPDCIFCKIAGGDIPVARLFEDEHVLAFRDREPQAPTHILVIPREHLPSHAHTAAQDEKLLGHLLVAAAEVARSQGLEKGYRLVINSGHEGGQTVQHLHIHLLGGRQMHWPPG